MFTVDKLLDIAIEAEATRNAIEGKPGQACQENMSRYELYNTIERAMLCARHMEHNGIKEIKYIGPFGELPFKQGDKVRIKKGALIRGAKGVNGGPKYAGRDYAVKAHNVFQGWVGQDSDHRNAGVDLRNPQISWSGKDGWYYTDANNVEVVA